MASCAVLVLIAAAQLVLPGAGALQDLGGLAPRRTKAVVVPPLPEYAAILNAPIFAPDRRPSDTAGAGAASAGATSLAGYAALGVAAGSSVSSAVIMVPNEGPKTLRRGDTVNGWRLVGVSRDRAVLERNGARQALIVGAPARAAAEAPSVAP